MESNKVTVYFTKLFTSGTLKGLTYDDKISYPTIEGCMKWIKSAQKGHKYSKTGAYKVVDFSFQKYLCSLGIE